MFEDIWNTGDDHWSPSSGAAPNTQETEPDDDKDEDYKANEASDDCHEISPEPSKGKRPAPTSQKDKGKKPKTPGGHWVQDQLNKLVSMSERLPHVSLWQGGRILLGVQSRMSWFWLESVVLFQEAKNTS
jgi:hypothetical protein